MLSADLFTRLRAAQLRSVREQELLSGRNWILICAVAHILGLVYPVFLWIHVLLLHPHQPGSGLHPALSAGILLFSGLVLLLFWRWARYAPYRASVLALLSFLAIHGVHAAFDPHQLAVATILKALVILGLLQAVIVAHGRRKPQ
jgi:hypothetical protein